MNKETLNLKNKFEELKKKFLEKKNDEVIEECNNILKKNKIDVFYNLLCLAHNNKGNFLEAIDVMKEALKQSPKNVDFLNNIGMSYTKIYKYKKAETFYNKGLEIDKNNLHIMNNLANLKKDLDKSAEAVELYKKILSKQPDAMAAMYNLANLYNTIGEFDKSKKLFFDILELKPDLTEADRIISQMTNYDSEHSHFIDMEKKLSNTPLDEKAMLHLHFALGKAYSDQKKYKKSFENFKKANDLSKKISKYNFEIDRKRFLNVRDKFNSLKDLKINKNNRKFLFIIGMPRSGTSLTEQIISSHENVFGGGELPYIKKIYENYFELNKKVTIDNLLDCERDYIEYTSNLDNSNKVFTDKAPLNFFYIGFILKFLPNSKFINIVRNPIDNCWSIYKNYFPTKIDFANNLDDLAKYYDHYKNLMNFWRKIFPSQIYDLCYENLVSDTKKEVEKLLKFCSLEWDEKCLQHHKNKRVIKTISYSQARKPIYNTSVKSFKGYEDYLGALKDLN